MSDTELTETNENDAQETVVIVISDFKKQKRNAKSLLTRLLSCLLSEENPNRENICHLLVKIDEQKDICLEVCIR
jgi:hypothetical protein